MQDIEALCREERKRVNLALRELKVTDGKADDVMGLVRSYSKDADHFFSQSKFLQAFELYVYIFGLLDALARLGFIDPGAARKHFKVEQVEE